MQLPLKNDGSAKGYAFLTYQEEMDAKASIEALNQYSDDFFSQPISVKVNAIFESLRLRLASVIKSECKLFFGLTTSFTKLVESVAHMLMPAEILNSWVQCFLTPLYVVSFTNKVYFFFFSSLLGNFFRIKLIFLSASWISSQLCRLSCRIWLFF